MSDPRHQIVDAVLEALRHTLGRDQHMPVLLELVQHQIGPITYVETRMASLNVMPFKRGLTLG
jgi:hypothetical protein